MKVVFDPNVLVAALLSPTGAPRALIERWVAGHFEIVVSDRLLGELYSVLGRTKFRRYVTEQDATEYVDELRSSGVFYVDPAPQPGLTPEPGDDYLVALAQEAQANALVSGDDHLVELVGADPPVMTPRAFLEAVDKLA